MNDFEQQVKDLSNEALMEMVANPSRYSMEMNRLAEVEFFNRDIIECEESKICSGKANLKKRLASTLIDAVFMM